MATKTLHTYYFATDSCQQEIEAPDADAAAREFAKGEGMKGVLDADDLATYLERVGGYGSMRCEDTGETIFDIPS